MKKTAKRILCMILIMALFISSMPVSTVYAGNSMNELFDPSEPDDLEIDLDDASNEFINNANSNNANLIDPNNQGIISFASLFRGIQFFNTMVGAYNGIRTVLTLTGVLNDPSAGAMKTILQELDQLNVKVEVLNTKISAMQDTLDKGLVNLGYKSDEIKANSFKQNWTAFLNDNYQPMVDFFNAYKQQTKEATMEWADTWNLGAKTALRCLYNKDGDVLYNSNNYDGYNNALPERLPRSADNSDNEIDGFDTSVYSAIVLPAAYLIADGTTVNANNYLEVISNTVSSAVKQAMADEQMTVDPELLSTWKEAGIETDEDIVAKITDDMIGTMHFEVNSQLASAKYDNSTSYASKTVSLYNNLCAAINGTNGRSAALNDIFKNLALTYAFEGDAKESATAYYALIGTAVMQYGEFTSMLVAMNPKISSDTNTELVKLTTDTLTAANDKYDSFITGNDNYCYPLEGVVTYVDVKSQSVIRSYNDFINNGASYSATKNNDISDWAIIDSSINFDMNDLDVYKQETKKNEAALRNSMVDPSDMMYLNCYIKASAGDDMSAIDYLKKNGVITSDGDHSTTLVTSDFKVEDQPLDNDTQYKVFPYANDNYQDNLFSDRPLPGYEKDKHVNVITDAYLKKINTDVSYGYKAAVHDKLVGTTFSIDKSAADISTNYKGNAETILGVRIMQYRNDKDTLLASPRYFFYDDTKSDVNLSVSENATDPENSPKRGSPFQEAYRCYYTVTAEKAYGALCVDYKNGDPYKYDVTIESSEDFLNFRKSIANGNMYEGKRILLKTDLDLSGVDLEMTWPSTECKREFKGYFNGDGHVISNLKSNVAGDRVALFRTTGKGAVIENLTLKNVAFSAKDKHSSVGALVGYAGDALTVTNIQVSGSLNGYDYVGGIVGESQKDVKIIFLECTNSANIEARNAEAGGMLGNAGEIYVRGCMNSGNVSSGHGSAGGMVGMANKTAVVINSHNTGNITADDSAGGIVGKVGVSGSDYRFTNFTANENKGVVTATARGSAGGTVGFTNAGGKYIGNTNSGSVVCKSSSGYAGGILGGNEDDLIMIKYNKNTGAVEGVNKTGGIAGSLGNKEHDNIVMAISNTNSGTISATDKETADVGGIFGAVITDNTRHEIKNNTNTGDVTAPRQAGGIIGYMAGGGTIDANTSKANITSLTENAGGLIGKIEDDKCEFTGSVVDGEAFTGSAGSTGGYLIFAQSSKMHAGKICGWDGNRKVSIDSEELLASIFGNGNVLMIIALVIVLAIAAAVIIIVNKKKKKAKEVQNS